MTVPVTIRPAVLGGSSEENFIHSSWLRSQRSWVQYGLNEKWTEETAERVKAEIARCLANSTILVACQPNDEEQILGWVSFDPGTIHYLYIKSPFRRFRIGFRLWEAAGSPKRCANKGFASGAIRARYGLTETKESK